MSRPAWFEYDRPAEHEAVVSSVRVPLRNGLTLAGDLALPDHGGPFPCLLIHYTPYGRGERADILRWWARHGFAALCCDIRGTHDSQGSFPEPASMGECEDNYDAIEWLAAQPFANGKVGQYGQSYGALTALRVAALRPPHLAAIAPQQSWSSYYDYKYPGGIQAARGGVWPDSVPEFTGGRMSGDWLQTLWGYHPLLDDFWRQTDINTKYESIAVPILLYGGWFDIFKQGGVENFTALKRHAYFVTGPWPHGLPEQMADAPATLGMLLAWFDHWLGGRDAPLPSARVTTYEVPRSTSPGWQEFEDFPPPGAVPWRVCLRTDRSLGGEPGEAGERGYAVDGSDGPATYPGLLPDDPAADQRARDDVRLHFQTQPLGHDIVVAGSPVVKLRAALSATEGYFVLNLMDVAPDGRVLQAASGCLRATHRLGHDRVVSVTPGEMASYEIPIQPVHWRFKAGHRVRLSISSGNAAALVRDAPAGTVTVATGEHGSSAEFLVLPG